MLPASMTGITLDLRQWTVTTGLAPARFSDALHHIPVPRIPAVLSRSALFLRLWLSRMK
jgi:hypothetical protein